MTPSELMLREFVVDTVANTLRVDAAAVTATPTLFDLDGFDSMAIVSILDRLEGDLCVEVPPERILPQAFASVDSLCELFAAAAPAAPATPATPVADHVAAPVADHVAAPVATPVAEHATPAATPGGSR